MGRRRVTYRPSRSGCLMGGILCCVFVVIGLVVVIPAIGGAGGAGMLIGVAWTVCAAVMAGVNFYRAFGKGYVGPEIHIEDEQPPAAPGPEELSPQARLELLQSLYDRRLITQAEYEQKRREILEEL